MEPIEPKEMALQITEDIRLLQSQIEALKDWILEQHGAPTLKTLDKQLFALESVRRNSQQFREKSAEFQDAIRNQDDVEDILQSLHSFLKAGKMTA